MSKLIESGVEWRLLQTEKRIHETTLMSGKHMDN